MALIRCKLIREGGTKVEIHGKTLHFRPATGDQSESPDHVCEVENPDSIHRLLKIKEAYELVDPAEELPAPTGKSYGSGQAIANDQAVKEKGAPIIISNGEEEINLSDMDLEPLRALAVSAFDIKPHHKWSRETIIAKIIEKNRITEEA